MKSVIAAVSLTFKLQDSQRKDLAIFKNIHKVIPESWLVDRTENIKLPFSSTVKNENKIPLFLEIKNKDLLSCCLDRASDFISTGKKLYLMWSGGLDSTVILISFILSNVPRDQVVIVCNPDSLRENYNFYEKYIRGNYNLMSSELFMQEIKTSVLDGLIISGEQGDCMFGQDFGMDMFSKFGSLYLESSFDKNNLIKYFCISGMDVESADCWSDLFISNLNCSPRPVITMYDFSWWITYNWRWQWAKEKLNLRTQYDQQLETFFSSEQLQYWSVNHKQSSIRSLIDFKKDFKNIIFKFTNDSLIFSKIKHPSATVYYTANSFSLIDNQGKRYKEKEYNILDYYQEDNFINRWLGYV